MLRAAFFHPCPPSTWAHKPRPHIFSTFSDPQQFNILPSALSHNALKVHFMRLQFHSGGGAGTVNPICLASHADTLTWQKVEAAAGCCCISAGNYRSATHFRGRYGCTSRSVFPKRLRWRLGLLKNGQFKTSYALIIAGSRYNTADQLI